MIDERTKVIFLIIAAIVGSTAVFIGKGIPEELSKISNTILTKDSPPAYDRLSLIDSVVNSTSNKEIFEYKGDFENPFKQWNNVSSTKSDRQSSKSPRITLSLKGILMKDRPLAILENPTGETLIRGIGEKAFEQLIVSISDYRVVLRDHLGTYEISVKEK